MTEHGTIVVETWKWSADEQKTVLHKSRVLMCRKTAKRFILVGSWNPQFDHNGLCTAGQGESYKYKIRPETFVPDPH